MSAPDFIPDSQFKPDVAAAHSGDSPDFIPESQFVSDEDKYGGVSGALKAGAAGFLRGSTLGASDVLAVKSGLVKPETLRGLEEENPASSIAGEVGSVFVPGGVASLIGKGGKAVAGGLKALELAKLADEGTKAAKVLGAIGDVGAMAAGSAVEGAVYGGIGNTLNEYALGDPGLNAEKIAANFGHGAIMGGLLGGALESAAVGIPEGLKAAKNSIAALHETLMGTGENSGGLLAKVIPEKFTDAFVNRATRLGIDEQKQLVTKVTDELNSANKNLQTEVKRLNKDIRPQETEALINSANPELALSKAQELVGAVRSAADVMRKEPELYSSSVARELELFHDGLTKKVTNESLPGQILNDLRETKQRFQDIAYSAVKSASETKSKALVDDLQKAFNSVLHNPEIFGAAGSALASHDSILSKFYKFISPKMRGGTEFQKAFMTKVGEGPGMRWEFDAKKVERAFKSGDKIIGEKKLQLLNDYHDLIKELPEHIENTYRNVPNARFEKNQLKDILQNAKNNSLDSSKKYIDAVRNSKAGLGMGDYIAGALAYQHPFIGAAVKAYNIVQQPFKAISQLAEVERLVGKSTNYISKGAKAIFDPSVKVLEKARPVGSRLSSEEKLEEHKKNTERIASLSGDPGKLIDEIASNTEHLQGIAPEMAQNLQAASARAVHFLATKIPGPPHTNPFSHPYVPSSMELAKFDRYQDIVEKPLRAFDQVRLGTLTPETIETLTAVYPKLYDHMKQVVLNEATEMLHKKKPIPYSTKQSISMFLQKPLDISLSPQSAQMNQMIYAASPQPNQGMVRPTQGGLSNITLAQRTKLGRPQES